MILGYDYSEGKDHTCIIVRKKVDNKVVVTDVFYDEDARKYLNKNK